MSAAGGSRWNGPHLKKLRSQFPDYDDDFCLDVLEGCEGSVERAATFLKSLSKEPLPIAITSDSYQSEFPTLEEHDVEESNNPHHHAPIKKSSSDTLVIKNSQVKLEKNGKKTSGSCSSQPSTPFQDNDEHNAYRTSEVGSKFAQLSLEKPKPVGLDNKSKVNNEETADQDTIELCMKTYPPGTSRDFWNASLKEELQNPEIKNLLLRFAPRQGHPQPKVCIIMRGVPGSGKSHLSTIILGVCGGAQASADNYFIDRRGRYTFRPDELTNAHNSCQRSCRENMSKGISPIIIDNTNTTAWEMLPYAKMSIEFDYEFLLLEPCTPWKKNVTMLAKKNTHGIPKATINRMIGRFEAVTVDQLLEMAGIANKNPTLHKLTGSKSNPSVNTHQFKKAEFQGHNQPSSTFTAPQVSSSSRRLRQYTPEKAYVPNDLTIVTPSPQWSNLESSKASEFKLTLGNNKTIDDDTIFSRLIDQDQKRLISQSFKSDRSQFTSVPTVPRTPPGFSPIQINPVKENNLGLELEEKDIDETGKLVTECIDRLLEDNFECDGEKDLDDEVGAYSMGKPAPASSITPEPCVKQSKYDHANSLQNLFPDLEGDVLDDMFEKCFGDIDWCVDLLLDDGYKMSGTSDGPRETKINFDANGNIPNNFKIVENKVQKKRPKSLEVMTTPLPPLQFAPGSEEESSSYEGSIRTKDDHTESLSPRSSTSSNELENESFIPIDGEDWVDLKLPLDFVNTLTEKYSNPFGTTDFSSLFRDNISIRIPPQMAFQMFQLVYLNVIQNTKEPEEGLFQEDKCEKEEIDDNEDQSIVRDLMEMERVTSVGKIDFKRIMELESRLTERETKTMEECRNGIQTTMANRIHLTELCRTFPSIPRSELEFSYAKYGGKQGAIRALKEIYPQKYVPQPSMLRESSSPGPSNEKVAATASGATDNGPHLSSYDWREVADSHYRLTKEYQSKMKQTSKMAPGANLYYLEMSRVSREKMKIANANAKQAILDECRKQNCDPNVLDLHRLFVSEAVEAVKEHLRNRREYMRENKLRKLSYSIIFGQGKHSQSGPKVGPAVMRYLENQHIVFKATPGNPGSITVNLRSDSFENT